MGGGAPPQAPLRGVLTGFLSLTAGEMAARATAFIATTYLTRVLGPEGFGTIALATALCGYFALAVSAGFTDVGAREIARRPERAAAVAAGATLVRLSLACGAMLLVAVVAAILPKPPIVRLVVVLTGLSFFSMALDTSWVYKGLERTRTVAVAMLVGQGLYVALVLWTVRDPGHVARVPLAQVAGELGLAAILLLPLLRRGVRPDVGEGWRILRHSGFITLTRVFRTFIYTFDVVLIGLWLGDREVGLYAAAYRFCFLLVAVGAALHVAYLPLFARARSAEDQRVLAGRSVALSSTLALPMLVGGSLLAGPLLEATFGPGYDGAAVPFRLLLLSIAFIFLSGTTHNLLLVLGRTRAETGIIGLAAVLNFGLNLLAIPRFGMTGAAAVTAFSEATVLGLGVIMVARAGIPVAAGPWVRTGAATALMALALLAIGLNAPLPISLGAGVLTYVVALTALRAVPAEVMVVFRRREDTTRR